MYFAVKLFLFGVPQIVSVMIVMYRAMTLVLCLFSTFLHLSQINTPITIQTCGTHLNV